MVINLLLIIILTLLALDIGAMITLVFLERRDPGSVLAWLMAIILLPIVGFALYLIFGFKYFKSRDFRIKTEKDRAIFDRVRKGKDLGVPYETGKNLTDLADYSEIAKMLWADGGAFLTAGNQVDYFTEGQKKFDALFEAIAAAKSHVHLEYYIIENDELGERLLRALEAKAKEGVKVRLLYDDLGNKIPRLRYRTLTGLGGKVSGFYHSLVPSIGFRINYRNHRKIAVIDGTVGFIGGFNFGDEYLGLGPLGPWRDSAVRIRGAAVRALQLRFVVDWNYATKEGLGLGADYFPPPTSSPGTAAIQIVSGGPDTVWNPTEEEYVKIVNSAQKTCYLQTPYFIPDASVLTALRIAALSGVDVRIMIPGKPDHPFVLWASLSFVGELLDAGVRAFRYEAGFLHAKTVTIDDYVTSIGSANWDIRSFKWNFEANAVIYDQKLSEQYRQIFEDDMTRCTEVTKEWYAARSRWIRFKESIFRLFSGAL